MSGHIKSFPRREVRPPAARRNFIDAPPMGHFMLAVLFAVDQLDKACGITILDYLIAESRSHDVSHAQIYGALRKLVDAKYISSAGEFSNGTGSPPLKLYSITAAGREALRKTVEHYSSVVSFVTRNAPEYLPKGRNRMMWKAG